MPQDLRPSIERYTYAATPSRPRRERSAPLGAAVPAQRRFWSAKSTLGYRQRGIQRRSETHRGLARPYAAALARAMCGVDGR